MQTDDVSIPPSFFLQYFLGSITIIVNKLPNILNIFWIIAEIGPGLNPSIVSSNPKEFALLTPYLLDLSVPKKKLYGSSGSLSFASTHFLPNLLPLSS